MWRSVAPPSSNVDDFGTITRAGATERPSPPPPAEARIGAPLMVQVDFSP